MFYYSCKVFKYLIKVQLLYMYSMITFLLNFKHFNVIENYLHFMSYLPC